MKVSTVWFAMLGMLIPTIASAGIPLHRGLVRRAHGKKKAFRRVARVGRRHRKARLPKVRKRTRWLRKISLKPQARWSVTSVRLPPRFDAKDPVYSLAQMYKLAKIRNLDLKVLRKQLQLAQLASTKAWSILKPQLSLQASYTRNDNEVKFGNSVLTPRDQLAVQFQAQWAFFNLSAIPILQTAALSVTQTKHSIRQARREIMYGVARAYYSVLLADGMVDIARASWQNSKAHVNLAKARFRGGVVPRMAVTRAQLDRVQAERQWIQARNGLRNARLALALLLNRPNLKFRAKRPQAAALPSGNVASWRRSALLRRAEVKVAKTAVNVANKQLTAKWLEFLPTVAAQGNLQGINATGFGGRNYTWSVMLVAQLKLYNGGTRIVQVKEARNKLFQARLELAKSSQKVGNEVAQAAISIQNSKASLRVAQQQRKLAQENYAIAQRRFQTGAAAPVEVSDALTTLRNGQLAELQEALNYEMSLLELQRAMGTFQP